jgi:hypothetical protein
MVNHLQVGFSVNSRRRRGLDWKVTLNPVCEGLRVWSLNINPLGAIATTSCLTRASAEVTANSKDGRMLTDGFEEFDASASNAPVDLACNHNGVAWIGFVAKFGIRTDKVKSSCRSQ